ncbi:MULTISPECIES: hypothetical protein [Amycolatopsis]|uniref:Uncharacterized protein n=1 Tax=Amycolatopsis bullii TaxID=941987 RepID=A0ABQ3KPK1_9PSEU|nr:hypothetical protein [Amycolatopsis bullii]GHG42759.1 hypothetical protein GCM10017567_75840 [Amycolatopsis bullii]
MGLWPAIIKTAAAPWVVQELGAEEARADLVRRAVGNEYLHVHLLAMRLPYERRWTSRYHCSLTSYTRLEHAGPTPVEFLLTTSPASMRGITGDKLAKVPIGPTRLAGPVPYLGGPLDIEIGLFAIKEKDLAEPYLDFLQSVGELAGVSFVAPALSLIRPLKDGLNALVGTRDSVLGVGAVRTFTPVRTGVFAVLATTSTALARRQCVLSDDVLCWHDGSPVTDVAYVVFSIEASAARADWARLPEVGPVYAALLSAARADRLPAVKKLLAQFERTVLLSPDLIESDAETIVAAVKRRVERAMPAAGQTLSQIDLPAFVDLGVFPRAASEPANRNLVAMPR